MYQNGIRINKKGGGEKMDKKRETEFRAFLKAEGYKEEDMEEMVIEQEEIERGEMQ